MMPFNFSWVDRPALAAMGFPHAPEELAWLRKQGIEVIVSLTESPAPREWVNEAGMMLVHVPVPDMTPPTPEQFEEVLRAIDRAQAAGMSTAVHCAAGRGRTGAVLAAYLVRKGATAAEAIRQVRQLRPGSLETYSQEQAVLHFAERASQR
jgi:atypical dual specificity phosphatase